MKTIDWTRGLLVFGLGALLIAGCVATLLLSEEAGAETQRTGTPLSNPTTSTTQAGQVAKITPEQKAALVEARKILKEAWELATNIVPPSKPPESTASENRLTKLEQYKNKLLRGIEQSRFLAEDFATAPTSEQVWYLTLTQTRYGHLQEAVQTATKATFSSSGETLVVLKRLSDAGDLAGTMQVAEAQVRGKRYSGPERKQYEAELMAYMARRQAEAGKPEAHETLARAIEAIRSSKKAPYRTAPYFQHEGWAAIGCAQAAMGDEAGATESFQQAMQAVEAIKKVEYEGEKAAAMAFIGRAAALSGLKSVSQEAFQESSRLASGITDSRTHVVAIAHRAAMQILSGDRAAGLQTFHEALKLAESLTSGQQRRMALGDIVERQLTGGEREAAQAILEQMRRRAESLPDSKERQVEDLTIEGHEARLETPSEAVERAYAIQNDPEKQASRLAYAARRLIHSKDPVLTPEIRQRLSQTAEALLAKPLPDDHKKIDGYLGSLAKVQAVASGASAALQIAGRIGDRRNQRETYLQLVFLLNQKGDFSGAKQVLASLKFTDEELQWGSSGMTGGDAFRGLAKAQVMAGDIPGALIWARHESSLYRKAEALLGVALGMLEQEGIHELDHDVPRFRHLVGKGHIDKLAIACEPLRRPI